MKFESVTTLADYFFSTPETVSLGLALLGVAGGVAVFVSNFLSFMSSIQKNEALKFFLTIFIFVPAAWVLLSFVYIRLSPDTQSTSADRHRAPPSTSAARDDGVPPSSEVNPMDQPENSMGNGEKSMVIDGTDISNSFSKSIENESFIKFKDPFTAFQIEFPNYLIVKDKVDGAIVKLSDTDGTSSMVYTSGTRPDRNGVTSFLSRHHARRMSGQPGKSVGYNVLRDRFFVVTGTWNGDRDYYECIATIETPSGFQWAQFYFEYPKARAAEHEPYIDHMLDSFLKSAKIR